MAGLQVFVGKLISGETPTATAAELDALLQWLAGRRNQAANMVEDAFRIRGIPSNEARRCILQYLDSCLFCHGDDYYRLLGVSPGASFSVIRGRHKQLLQIFHPDRQQDELAWFTERTEQLNRAYAYLKENHGKSRPGNAAPKRRPAPTVIRKSRLSASGKVSPWKSVIANKNKLRRTLKVHLGTPEQFERRFYVALFLVPVIALLIVYLNQVGIMEHRNALAPLKGKEPARKAVVTEERFEAGDRPGHKTNIHTGFPDVVSPEGLAINEPSKIDLPLVNDATDEQIEFIYSDETRKLHIEGGNNRAGAEEAGSDAGENEDYTGVPASNGPGSDIRSAEDDHSEDGTLAPALKKKYGIALSYQSVPPANDVNQALPSIHSARSHPRRVPQIEYIDVPFSSSSERPLTRVSRNAAQNTVQHDDDDRRYNYEKRASFDLGQAGADQSANSSSAYVNGLENVERQLTEVERKNRKRLVVKGSAIEKVRANRFNVSADYSIDCSLSNGSERAESGRLTMYVVAAGDDARIQHVEHVVR